MNTNRWLLVVILVLAAVLRLWQLGEYPIRLTNDEAAIGYNAYSILKTGKDEHGAVLPVIFKSFGDWKPGLYIYLTVPSVAVFGLSEFSVRLPSALLGVLTILLIYELAKELFDKKVAIFSAFSLAVLPWHIHFSRGAWEANLALTLLVAGTLFFFKSFKSKKNIILSALFFAFSLWAYQSAKLASLIVLIGLGIFYYKEILKLDRKNLIISAVLGILISLPIITSLFTGKTGRVEVMSVFSYTRPLEYIESTIFEQENITSQDPVYILFHTEALNLFRGVAGRYLNYISGDFLFFKGDWANPRHTSVDMGYLLFVSVVPLLLGLYVLFKSKVTKEIGFVLFLLALSQIPAALTRDSAHGVRSLGMILPVCIILGLGLARLYDFILKQKRIVGLTIISLTFAAYLYSMCLYLDAYFVQNKYSEPKDYFYGYKQVVERVFEREKDYKRIIFSQSYDQPYMFFLFYGVGHDARFAPEVFQGNTTFQESPSGDVGLITHLGGIEFMPTNWYEDRGEENTLFIGRQEDFPQSDIASGEFNVEYINYPDDKPAFVLLDRK